MSILDNTNPMIDSCMDIFHRLSPQEQAILMKKLSEEIKNEKPGRSTPSTRDAFGAWQSDQSAEDIIRDIYESRTANREIDL